MEACHFGIKLTSILLSFCVAVAFSTRTRSCCHSIFAHEGRHAGGRPTRRRPHTTSPSFLALDGNYDNVPAREKRTEKWILLVEDEDELRKAVGEFLAQEGGYYVTGVTDARSAILLCRGTVRLSPDRSRFKFDPNFHQDVDGGSSSTNDPTQSVEGPDCLVIDIQLGKMSGLELLKIIRSSGTINSNLPVVLLTAKSKVDDRIAGYQAGADAYLTKPFDPYELLSVVDGLLSRDKFSTSGDKRGAAVQNNNVKTGHLKRQLIEIKSLLQDLGGSPDDFEAREEEQSPLDSLILDVAEIKDKIQSSAKLMDAEYLRSQSKKFDYDQFSPLSVLTPEERAIVHLVAQGMTNSDIATEMECSGSKIEKHITAMFKKAGVKKRADLVVWLEEYLEKKAKTDESNVQMMSNVTAEPDEIFTEARLSSPLTAEEKELVDFLLRGLTTEEIAATTKSTRGEIAKQTGSLFKKAQVKNKTELVRWWKESGEEMVV